MAALSEAQRSVPGDTWLARSLLYFVYIVLCRQLLRAVQLQVLLHAVTHVLPARPTP